MNTQVIQLLRRPGPAHAAPMIDTMPGVLIGLGLALVYALAVTRLTVLLAYDEITRPLRQALTARLNPAVGWHRKLAYVLGGADDDNAGCPWCLSMWVAAVVVPAAWFWHGELWLLLPALILAASQLTGMTASIGRG